MGSLCYWGLLTAAGRNEPHEITRTSELQFKNKKTEKTQQKDHCIVSVILLTPWRCTQWKLAADHPLYFCGSFTSRSQVRPKVLNVCYLWNSDCSFIKTKVKSFTNSFTWVNVAITNYKNTPLQVKVISKSSSTLLFFLEVLESQEVKVQPKVTGYLGHDVTLPCQFIPGPENAMITQVQWELQPPEGEKILIIAFNGNFGVNALDTFLKERVKNAEQSLIIKNVEVRDAGSYTCSITTFPSGSFEGTTNLVVQGE